MATATKAKKATREFWISRSPDSDSVTVWSGKAEPKVSTEPQGCAYCTDPLCADNQPTNLFVQRGGMAVTSECIGDFRRVTGINVKEGEVLKVRMTVVKRSK